MGSKRSDYSVGIRRGKTGCLIKVAHYPVNVLGQFLIGRFSGDPVWPVLGDPRGKALVIGPGDKHQTSGSRKSVRPGRTRRRYGPLSFQFVAGAERNPPCDIAGFSVDGH